MAEWIKLKIKKKSTKSYEAVFTNKQTGAPIDITGWTLYFTVKESMKDSDANAKIDIKITDHTDPKNGKSLISLTKINTNLTAKSYYYSFDFKDDEENEDTLFEGFFVVTESTRQNRN